MNKPMSLYEKLHILAFEIHEDGDKVLNVRNPDIALAYTTMIHMRSMLRICLFQFQAYAAIDAAHTEDTMTMVERQQLDERLRRHRGLVVEIEKLLTATPELPADAWKPIDTAPQDGRLIRLLGKTNSGTTYVESGRWINICWSVEQLQGFTKPTHWMAVERLPEGY